MRQPREDPKKTIKSQLDLASDSTTRTSACVPAPPSATKDASRQNRPQGLQATALINVRGPSPANFDHVRAVKGFSAPPPHQAPALPADLASELSQYISTEPVSFSPPPTRSCCSWTLMFQRTRLIIWPCKVDLRLLLFSLGGNWYGAV